MTVLHGTRATTSGFHHGKAPHAPVTQAVFKWFLQNDQVPMNVYLLGCVLLSSKFEYPNEISGGLTEASSDRFGRYRQQESTTCPAARTCPFLGIFSAPLITGSSTGVRLCTSIHEPEKKSIEILHGSDHHERIKIAPTGHLDPAEQLFHVDTLRMSRPCPCEVYAAAVSSP